MDIFVRPRKTILDGPPLYKTILVPVDDFENNFLQSVSQDLCNDFRQQFSRVIGLKSLAVSGEDIFGIRVMYPSLMLVISSPPAWKA